MKRPAHIVLMAAARFYTPLIVLFALSLALMRAPGQGAGFTAGLAFVLALVLHALVFGAAAARAAAPPWAARLLVATGFATALIGAGAPAWAWAGEAIEAGLFAATTGAGALIVAVLFGRAPSLSDEEW